MKINKLDPIEPAFIHCQDASESGEYSYSLGEAKTKKKKNKKKNTKKKLGADGYK